MLVKKALITGITGQDGSYLTEQLLENGYEVHGIIRRTNSLDRSQIAHLCRDTTISTKKLFLHYGELNEPAALHQILSKVKPDELYHLAGQSDVGMSFKTPEATCEANAMGVLRLLEILRNLAHPPRMFHAASSEIFGRPSISPQNELTPMAPISPYGCAKTFASQMVQVYRDTYGLYIVNGIMYNHESPRRGYNFVTQKICSAAAAIKTGSQSELVLGDIDAKRDWGDARDYVYGMWLSLQQPVASDYIFATGVLHSVKDVIETAFSTVGLTWENFVRFDPKFVRPSDTYQLVGDPTKAKRLLGWSHKSSFDELIREMTLALLKPHLP